MLNRVLCGDSFEIMKEIEENTIDLILTDPPYNISKESNFSKNSNNKKFNNISIDFGDWDHTEIDLKNFFLESYRVLKTGGTIIIFYDIWKANKIKFFAQNAGFKQPRVCQWVKTNPVPINSKKNYLSNAIEYFFIFVKKKKGVFNSEYDRGIYSYPICHGKERTTHPTQKPLGLIEDLIKKHSKVGDLVLDPFSGSGTTAVGCVFSKRNYLLIEKNSDYIDITNERLKHLTNEPI